MLSRLYGHYHWQHVFGDMLLQSNSFIFYIQFVLIALLGLTAYTTEFADSGNVTPTRRHRLNGEAAACVGGSDGNPSMDGRRAFSAAELRSQLIEVVSLHAGADSTILIDFTAIPRLANDLLPVVTVADALDNLSALTEPMATMATMIYDRPIVCAGEDGIESDPLTRKIRAGFSIACVISFAKSYLYDISTGDIDYAQVSLALLMRDWERLVELFQESLRIAQLGTSTMFSQYGDNVSQATPVYRRETPFDNAWPMSEPVASRQISAESYWNLNSVAEQKRWGPDVVKILLEEYLFPDLHPDLVYYSDVVSSEEWVDLYEWLQDEGRLLWRFIRQ